MPEFIVSISTGADRRDQYMTTVNASSVQAAIVEAAHRVDANATEARVEVLKDWPRGRGDKGSNVYCVVCEEMHAPPVAVAINDVCRRASETP